MRRNRIRRFICASLFAVASLAAVPAFGPAAL